MCVMQVEYTNAVELVGPKHKTTENIDQLSYQRASQYNRFPFQHSI